MEDAARKSNLELLQVIIKQEESLQLDHMDTTEAWKLGLILRDMGMAFGANMAVHISLLGTQVFHCGLGQPKPNNDRWIARKERGTLDCWKSSLRLKLEALTGGNQLQDHGFTATDVVFMGGCFPLRLKSLGVVGAVTVSGLSDAQDHQLAVDALAKYLGVEVPRLPTA